MPIAGPKTEHPAVLSAREALLFEAGVKMGGVFHQYLGTPVSPETAPGLAQTIASAVALQPYVLSVEVRIDPSVAGPLGPGRFGYGYLTAEMLDVTVLLADGDLRLTARLAYRADLRYPLMRVVSLTEGGRGRERSAVRSARTRDPSAPRTAPSVGSTSGPGTPRARGRSSRRRGSRRRSA
jgi:hypothetical protein